MQEADNQENTLEFPTATRRPFFENPGGTRLPWFHLFLAPRLHALTRVANQVGNGQTAKRP
jgi:hypothetical protein